MNRTDWEASNDPLPMLTWLRLRGSERKFRLFACAAARQFTARCFVHTVNWTPLILGCETWADGGPAVEPLVPELPTQHQNEALQMANALTHALGYDAAREMAVNIRGWLNARIQGQNGWHWPITGPDHLRDQTSAQAALMRDLFGHVFHAAPLWLAHLEQTSQIEQIAKAIYLGRSFADLPVLADALEDAGCDDVEALAHCREEGDHVRGCWVIDAILRKS